MFTCKIQLIYVAIIIIIIVIIITSTYQNLYQQFLSGFWIGEPAFLNTAQLSDLQLFIAPPINGSRQGYLIITDLSGEFISNQAIEIFEESKIKFWKSVKKPKNITIEYDDSPSMPEEMKMTISIIDGTITLYDDDKVYAFMIKDSNASAIALKSYNE